MEITAQTLYDTNIIPVVKRVVKDLGFLALAKKDINVTAGGKLELFELHNLCDLIQVHIRTILGE